MSTDSTTDSSTDLDLDPIDVLERLEQVRLDLEARVHALQTRRRPRGPDAGAGMQAWLRPQDPPRAPRKPREADPPPS